LAQAGYHNIITITFIPPPGRPPISMIKGIAFLLAGGLAQAALLKNNESVNQDHRVETEGDLAIKMPDAVAPEIKAIAPDTEKPKMSQSLIQETSSMELDMVEGGVMDATMKPIVKAKVKKVMSFIQSRNDEYEHGTEDQRKALRSKAESLIMQSSGTRGYNEELCNELWGEATQWAGDMSTYYCPSITYPAWSMRWEAGGSDVPPYELLFQSKPSALRSAWLTDTWITHFLQAKVALVIDQFCDDVSYYDGTTTIEGITKVSQTLPMIGMPWTSELTGPEYWICNTECCLTPVIAWAQRDNYFMSCYAESGCLKEVIIPLNLWR